MVPGNRRLPPPPIPWGLPPPKSPWILRRSQAVGDLLHNPALLQQQRQEAAQRAVLYQGFGRLQLQALAGDQSTFDRSTFDQPPAAAWGGRHGAEDWAGGGTREDSFASAASRTGMLGASGAARSSSNSGGGRWGDAWAAPLPTTTSGGGSGSGAGHLPGQPARGFGEAKVGVG